MPKLNEMKRPILFTILIIFLSEVAVSQSVGISATAIVPNPYSILEVESKTSGILLPRLNAGERATLTSSGIGITEQGLTIYNTDTDHYNYWDGYAWVEIATGSTSGSFIENQNAYQQIADFNIGGDGIMTKLGVGTGMTPLGAQSHFHDGDPTGGNMMLLIDDNPGNPIMSIIDYGEIGIGTATPNGASMLDINGPQGVLLPRMTNPNMNLYGSTTLSPIEAGMIVYDSTNHVYNSWDGYNLIALCLSPGSFIENQNAVLQPADYRIAGLGVASQMGVGTGMGAILGSHHVHDANIGAGDQLLYVDDYIGLPIMTVLDEGRVGIGTSIPNPHSILDVMDTLRGVLLPRLSSTQKATLGSAMGPGEEGMMVYDLTLQTYDFWDGTGWSSAGSGSGMYIDNQNTGAQPADYWINGNGEADQIGVGTNGAGFGASLHVHDDNSGAGDKLFVVDDFVGNDLLNVIDAGHVTIGAAIPAAHSILDVQSTTKGVLFPRMNPTQMTALATGLGPTDNGMTVYNSLDNRYEVWDGYAWIPILSGLPGDFIVNQNTAVQPADFNLGGTGVTNKLGVGTGLGPVTGLAHLKDNSPTAGSRLLKIDDFIGNPLVTVVDGGQVGLGTTAPTASSILDMNSTNKGFLPPRMTATQRAGIIGPVQGLIVYQTTTPDQGLWHYDGAFWNYIGSMSAPPTFLEDADGDTKVEVEQSADEDIVRFTTYGTEYLNMDQGRLNVTNTGGSTFLGDGAGANDDLSNNNNVAIGSSALTINTTGYSNTAVGESSLVANTTGFANSAFGVDALSSNTTGRYNTSLGMLSTPTLSTGLANTAVGYTSLYLSTTGSENTAVGHGAGHLITTGSNNTCIGKSANVSGTVNNSSAFGNGANVTASNSIELGNASVTSIGGYTNWTNLSDGRCKQNIEADVPGLEFVNKLRPVTYNLDLDAIAEIKGTPDSLRSKKDEQAKEQIVYTGLIAQEVESAANDLNYDFSGVDTPQNENDHYALRYAEFATPLIKAVQELHDMNRDLKMEVEVLRRQVANIQTTASK